MDRTCPEKKMPDDPLHGELHSELPEGNADAAVHVSVQRKLQHLRLDAIKAYMKVTTDGGGAFAENSNQKLQLHADILGLGPK